MELKITISPATYPPPPQIPRTSEGGDYRLRIEGNVPGTIGGTIFSNDTQLFFSTRFLTILIQTNRPVYTGEQTGEC